jgi:hypothetical protein
LCKKKKEIRKKNKIKVTEPKPMERGYGGKKNEKAHRQEALKKKEERFELERKRTR